MEIRVRVVRRDGLGRPREVPLTVSESGIEIGRALTSDLCLEDHERVVSGLHARIQARGGRIWLTDLSRNGTCLNDNPAPIAAHRPVELHDGDRLMIGPYAVHVAFGASSPTVSFTKPQQPAPNASLQSDATLAFSDEASRTEVLNAVDSGQGRIEEPKTEVLSRLDPC